MHTLAHNPKSTRQHYVCQVLDTVPGHFGQSPEVSILQLQRTIGNQAVQRMLQTLHPRAAGALQTAGGLVQRASADVGVAPDAEAAVSRAAQGSGSELPSDVRRTFESGLGADLSGVRLHTSGGSAEAAQTVGAKAYATGQNIHFAAGRYQRSTAPGLHLLAHEVARTVQQAGGAATGRQHQLEVSAGGDALEVEADRVADALVAGSASVSLTAGGGLHREPAPEPARLPQGGPEHDRGEDQGEGALRERLWWRLQERIDHFDANHDGSCEQSEVIALLKAADCKFTGAAAVAPWSTIANGVIKQMDTDKDGKISYAEFDTAINAPAAAP